MSAPPTGARSVPGRLGWGVADQAVSSLTNFALGVAVARTAGPAAFGAFSIVFAVFLVALTASRGLTSDPFLVRYSAAECPDRRRAARSCTGTAVALGLVVGAVCLLAGLGLRLSDPHHLGASVGAPLVALGLTLPGLLLQDCWRFCFFAAGRGGAALVNDLVWAVTLGVLLAVTVVAGRTGTWVFVAVWGASGNVAALAGCRQAGLLPQPARALGWLRDHRELAGRYLAENLSTSSGLQLRALGIGLIAGLPAVGAVKGAELMLGPVYVLVTGMASMGVAEAARAAHRSTARLRRVCLLTAATGAAGTVAWGGVLMLGVPDVLGRAVLGETWQPAAALLVPLTIAFAGTAALAGPWAGVRALGAARRSLRAQLLSSGLTLGGSLAGAAVNDATGAAWGTAAASVVSAGVWWWQLRGAVTDSAASTPG